MKPSLLVGLVLVILGIAGLAVSSFSYTKREEVLKIGPIEATAEREHQVPIPPAACWTLIVGGIGVAAVGFVKRS
jgi:hypothetical protein